MRKVQSTKYIPWPLLVVFFVLIAVIVNTGIYYYTAREKIIKRAAQYDLATIAKQKVRQIANWRNERKGDALSIQNSTAIAHSVNNYFKKSSQKVILNRWLQSLCRGNGYSSATLFDT